MKSYSKFSHSRSLIALVYISLLHLPAIADSNSTTTDSLTIISDSQSAKQPYTTAKKKTLNQESRGLSVFLMIGIGINVIMASVFIWWFTSEWRKTNKYGKSNHDD